MKRVASFVIFWCAITLSCMAQMPAQHQQRFSPERFEAELQEFITREAGLSAEEAARFFPLYKEMQDKQRQLFARQRGLGNEKPADDAGCLRVINERDDIDLELKRIQKNYHARFLEIFSASKLYDILKAEERFHRRVMRNWGRGSGQQGQQGQHQHRQWPQAPHQR